MCFEHVIKEKTWCKIIGEDIAIIKKNEVWQLGVKWVYKKGMQLMDACKTIMQDQRQKQKNSMD